MSVSAVRTSARPARPTAKAQATRAGLVEAAGHLFAEDGFAAASLQDLGRRLGLTTGAIYGHFRGKADLLAAAVMARITRDLEAPQWEHPQSFVDSLQEVFRRPAPRRAMRALLLEGAVAARTDPEVREQLKIGLEARLADWTSLYETWQREQPLDPDVDMATVVKILYAIELGLASYEALGIEPPAGAPAADVIRRLVESLQSPQGEDRP